MKPIEAISAGVVNRINAGLSSRVSATGASQPVRSEEAGSRTGAQEASPARALAGSEAPVDTDRVDVIRKAVEQGKYPVLPARIADAMIAAGYLLRTQK